MTLLRFVLAAQLAFFATWGGWLLTSHRDAVHVWLAPQPVDPRDLLAGHYVALSYRLSADAAHLCPQAGVSDEVRTIFLRLAPGEHVATVEGPVEIARAVECRSERPAEGTWIAGRRSPGDRRVEFGIERYYVPEESPLRSVQANEVVVRVAIAADGEARVDRLVERLPVTAVP